MTDDKAAELLAAVRAVESGKAPAASFFTEPGPERERKSARTSAVPRPATPTAPATPDARPAPTGERARSGAVAVPDEVRAVLAEGGAPEALGLRVVEALGEQAAEVLRADPWQLLAATGVRPEQADGFARALLGAECGPDDDRRAQALVGWLLERAALAGHTALEPAALTKGLSQHAVPDPDEAVRAAIDSGAVLLFEDSLDAMPGGGRGGSTDSPGESDGSAEERPVSLSMGLDRYALAEESLADGLARVISTRTPPPQDLASDEDADSGSDSGSGSGSGQATGPGRSAWEAVAAVAPSPSAAELIRAVADHGLVAHTGGEAARAEPVALVAAARELGLRAYVAAHSTNGRTRLARLLTGGTDAAGQDAEADAASTTPDGGPASRPAAVVTVAGLLAGREGPGREEEDGAWALDMLVLCDAPQLDAESAAALVESLPDGARLVLSGDPGLLGSAGPGQVFADVLSSRACPQVASRTPDPGPIGELVSGIGIGELSPVDAPGKEVVIVPVGDAGEAVHRTVQLVADSVPRALSVPVGSTQVITPGHGGAAGTRALNAALKERLNPGHGRFGGFDPGDRVAHSPAPGRTELGTVVSADEEGLRLEYSDTGLTVVVARERVAETVRHGWAVTAHQSVGMRWPAAVVVLPGDATAALTREWVYTAFSRGERHVSVVHGAGDALPHAVTSVTTPGRTTRLRTLLTQSARAAASAAAAQEPVSDG